MPTPQILNALEDARAVYAANGMDIPGDDEAMLVEIVELWCSANRKAANRKAAPKSRAPRKPREVDPHHVPLSKLPQIKKAPLTRAELEMALDYRRPGLPPRAVLRHLKIAPQDANDLCGRVHGRTFAEEREHRDWTDRMVTARATYSGKTVTDRNERLGRGHPAHDMNDNRLRQGWED